MAVFFFLNIVLVFFFFQSCNKDVMQYFKLLVLNCAERFHETDTLERHPWAH